MVIVISVVSKQVSFPSFSILAKTESPFNKTMASTPVSTPVPASAEARSG